MRHDGGLEAGFDGRGVALHVFGGGAEQSR